MKPLTSLARSSGLLAAATLAACASTNAPAPGPLALHGYVLDSACALIKDLDRPISRECAIQCAQAGSPLVILGDDGRIYWPISAAMPAVGQNERLLPFAGERVIAHGQSYVKGGSIGLVIEHIEREAR